MQFESLEQIRGFFQKIADGESVDPDVIEANGTAIQFPLSAEQRRALPDGFLPMLDLFTQQHQTTMIRLAIAEHLNRELAAAVAFMASEIDGTR